MFNRVKELKVWLTAKQALPINSTLKQILKKSRASHLSIPVLHQSSKKNLYQTMIARLIRLIVGRRNSENSFEHWTEAIRQCALSLMPFTKLKALWKRIFVRAARKFSLKWTLFWIRKKVFERKRRTFKGLSRKRVRWTDKYKIWEENLNNKQGHLWNIDKIIKTWASRWRKSINFS